jgi:hypothetical protein
MSSANPLNDLEGSCNCWNCRFLLPALKEFAVRVAATLDEHDELGTLGMDPSDLLDEAIDLCAGKVRSESAASLSDG